MTECHMITVIICNWIKGGRCRADVTYSSRGKRHVRRRRRRTHAEETQRSAELSYCDVFLDM